MWDELLEHHRPAFFMVLFATLSLFCALALWGWDGFFTTLFVYSILTFLGIGIAKID